MMENLLPCPFCGGEAEIFDYDPENEVGFHEPYTVQCSNQCCCLGKDFRTREEAAEAWNRRAQPEQPEAVHGQWKTVEVYSTTARYRCTACEAEMIDCIDRKSKHRYCHNCGAKMDGGEKDAAN